MKVKTVSKMKLENGIKIASKTASSFFTELYAFRYRKQDFR